MFLNSMFQKSDHLSPLWKSPPQYTPSTKFLLPPPKVNRPPLNKNFHVISQENFIYSCSHCSCTIFILPSYSLRTQVKLILILINVQYLQIVVFSFKKGLIGQKYSSSDSHQPIRQYPSFSPNSNAI